MKVIPRWRPKITQAVGPPMQEIIKVATPYILLHPPKTRKKLGMAAVINTDEGRQYMLKVSLVIEEKLI